ncbi:hypothetical protein [Ornithinimicrobium murale]|uniref:hypothetical protein n=1 Tax=Ornithinimicrobium murale TaxID=1050153 RepID=UPI000E0DD8D4|nr:hypothetical protein [Ornithinimicrobium murale]
MNIVLTQDQQDQAVLDIVRSSGQLCKMPNNKLTRGSLWRLRKAGLLRYSRDPGTSMVFVFPVAEPVPGPAAPELVPGRRHLRVVS